MRRELKIRQLDSYDCGAACLLSVSVWWGVKVPLSTLRSECGCTPQGISIEGIIDGAKSVGLQAKGFKSTATSLEGRIENLKELSKTPQPVIAHLTREDGFLHFVVIYKVTPTSVVIMDPAEGDEVRVKLEDFAAKWNGYVVMLEPGESFKKGRSGESPLRWTMRMVKPYRRALCKALAGSMFLALLGFANSLIMQILIDEVIPSGSHLAFLGLSSLLLFLLPVSLLMGYARNLLLINSSVNIDTSVILNYLHKIFQLPPQFFEGWASGDICNRLTDSYKIRLFVTEYVLKIIVSSLTFIVVVVLMFAFYSKLALYALCFIPLYTLLYWWANRISKRYNKEIARSNALFESNVIDSIEGAESVKHHLSSRADILYSESYNTLMKIRLKSAKISSLFGLTNGGVGSLFLIVIIIVSAFAILNGDMSVGEMVAFYTLSSFFILPMNEIIEFNTRKNEALVAAERVCDVMNVPSEEQGGEKLIAEENRIKLENLGFKYKGREEVFRGVNFEFERGKIYVISGENGCGKSTLGKLLMRDLVPTSGRILLGGKDIQSYNIASWREFAGVVPQRVHLLNNSILNNIVSFKKEPDLEKVAEVCAKAGLMKTLERLPEGVTAFVGKGGRALSGGEAAKVALARLLYSNPTLCIFDEATSFMDPQSEKLVEQIAKELALQGKIVIIISHEEEMKKIADQVLDIKAESDAPTLSEKIN